MLTHQERHEVIEPYGEREHWLLSRLAPGIDASEFESLVRKAWSNDADQLHAVLNRLIAADIVRVLPPSPPVPERYERTLAYLSQFAGNGGGEHDLLERLRTSAVLVAGVGGLGSWITAGLACLGIGQLRLVDCDIVEESNLNRSLTFREADVGESKVAALARRLEELTSHTEVRAITHDLASDLLPADVLSGATVVISTADKPAWVVRAKVAKACVARGLPFICPRHPQGSGFHASVAKPARGSLLDASSSRGRAANLLRSPPLTRGPIRPPAATAAWPCLLLSRANAGCFGACHGQVPGDMKAPCHLRRRSDHGIFPPEAARYFEQVDMLRYPFTMVFSSEDYLAILGTQSITHELGEARRSDFLERVRRRLEALGSPDLTATFIARLAVGRRREVGYL
ncbi:MAG TPA: ThiF family adenylyltransferase [Streptosporangiaceae bacterium]|nr:ThiF family adenylyltransferase [Streptosporangiaceae bacterium]